MAQDKIVGLDLENEQMRFFPVMQGIIEVVAPTKKKAGYVKVALPDEMIQDLMMASLGLNEKTKHTQYIVSCVLK